MELFFETYLIISLTFAIITICIAGVYLKSKKYTIGFSALLVFLGAIVPNGLILLQEGYGSLWKIDWLTFADGRTTEEILEDSRHIFVEYPSRIEQVFDSFARNLGLIVLSIAIGITLGILVHLLLQKQKIDNPK
jgi:hypothetical protein